MKKDFNMSNENFTIIFEHSHAALISAYLFSNKKLPDKDSLIKLIFFLNYFKDEIEIRYLNICIKFILKNFSVEYFTNNFDNFFQLENIINILLNLMVEKKITIYNEYKIFSQFNINLSEYLTTSANVDSIWLVSIIRIINNLIKLDVIDSKLFYIFMSNLDKFLNKSSENVSILLNNSNFDFFYFYKAIIYGYNIIGVVYISNLFIINKNISKFIHKFKEYSEKKIKSIIECLIILKYYDIKTLQLFIITSE